MPEEAEIAMARSAAPASIADGATVDGVGRSDTGPPPGGHERLCVLCGAVLGQVGGFYPEFWNPKLHAPNCFNAAAAEERCAGLF